MAYRTCFLFFLALVGVQTRRRTAKSLRDTPSTRACTVLFRLCFASPSALSRAKKPLGRAGSNACRQMIRSERLEDSSEAHSRVRPLLCKI